MDGRIWLCVFWWRETVAERGQCEGAYWIPEGVEEIEPGALIGCQIGTLHVPWTAHVHEHDQLVFSEDEEENEILMPPVYFWTKAYSCRDDETWAFEDEGKYGSWSRTPLLITDSWSRRYR